MHEVVTTRDDRVFVPLRDVFGHRLTFGCQPAHAVRIDNNRLSVQCDHSASPLLVSHRVVHRRRMDVALITANRPLPHIRQFATAILNAGIVPSHFRGHSKFKVFQHSPAPDQKLIVRQVIGTGRFANNTTILNGPKFRITIPAGEVRSIKQGTKPCIAVLSRRYSAFQKTEPDKTNDDQQQILHGPELEQRKEEAKKADITPDQWFEAILLDRTRALCDSECHPE